ncbi:hypothetical protein ABZW03_06930 [Kitasatospora sp. NPDC004799]|uniref:hypothetical protein n=1 Tax=Kitasatospora sp. NPDC004799 TaxID=3154460 RepID=UPI0033A115A0
MAPRAPRRIHVDGRDYRWLVRFQDGEHVLIRAWPDRPGPRRGRPVEFTRRFDDPWLHYGVLLTAPADRITEVFRLDPVTPALTAAVIRAALAAGWQPERPGAGAPDRFTVTGEEPDVTLLRRR